MTAFAQYLAGITFAANSKVKKLLKSGRGTDLELAMAVKTTKAYKEDPDLASMAESIIAGKSNEKKDEPAMSQTKSNGEPRRF